MGVKSRVPAIMRYFREYISRTVNIYLISVGRHQMDLFTELGSYSLGINIKTLIISY